MTRVRKRLHLDFHNHPTVLGIGANATADSFKAGLQELGVDSVVLFAKCHHGMSYYRTAIGQPHPGMSYDLLAAQVEACDAAGIEYHLYFSVLRENQVYDAHPEWRWLDANGNPSSPDGEWRLVCLNAGYYRDHLKPQILEAMERFPRAAGIWLDIIRYKGNECHCPNCVRDAQAAGLSAQDFNERMCLDTFRDLQETLHSMGKELTLNTFVFFGNQEWRSISPIEIESILAHVGPFHFPLFSRYLNRYPTERYGITHSFYQNWREFGTAKHPVQMNYEVCQMSFSGFGASLGDELEPDGTFEPRRFPVLRGAYRLANHLSDICDLDAKPVPEVAVLASESSAVQEDGQPVSGNRDSFVRGALKALVEAHYQIAVLDPEEDFSSYMCLIAQAAQLESGDMRRRVDAFIAAGGRAVILGPAGPACLAWLGLKRTATGNAEYQFLEVDPGKRLLVRSRMEMLEPVGDLTVAANGYLPYGDSELGEREKGCVRPPDPDAKSPTVFTRSGLVYCAPDVLSDYFDRGNWSDSEAFRLLLGKAGIGPIVSGRIPESAEVWLCESESGYELRVLDCGLKRENVIFAQQTEYALTRDYSFSIRTPRPVSKAVDKSTELAIPSSSASGALTFAIHSSSPFLVIALT